MVHGQSQAMLEGEPCSPDAQLGLLFLFSQENEPIGTMFLGLKAFLGCLRSKPVLGATSKDLSLIILVFHSMLPPREAFFAQEPETLLGSLPFCWLCSRCPALLPLCRLISQRTGSRGHWDLALIFSMDSPACSMMHKQPYP